jgi:S1-C subfamily serine protease
MGSNWHAVSEEIKQAINQAGKSIVAVDGRSGHTSSGILWRADTVITAAHTVRQDTGIRVILGPERSVQARLAGRDRGADIAVLRLDQNVEAQPAAFGNSATLSVGDLTVAIARTRRGNIVASAGIISGLMGEWQARRTLVDQFIRPDLTMYPGFSGGALLGPDGLVLGLNTSGLFRGKPLTIPSSTLERIAAEIASKGHVTRPYVGLVMQPVQIPESLQKKAGVKAETGLLVMHVEPGGPSDAGGVLLGDVLVEFDGGTFDDLDDIHQILDRKASGAEVQAVLLRGGGRVQLTIKIGARPSS